MLSSLGFLYYSVLHLKKTWVQGPEQSELISLDEFLWSHSSVLSLTSTGHLNIINIPRGCVTACRWLLHNGTRVRSPRGPADDQKTNTPQIKIINSLGLIMAADGQKTCFGWKQSRRTEGKIILRGHILAAVERAALAGSSVCGFMLRQHSQWTMLSKRFFQLVEIYSRRPPAPNIWKHCSCIGQRSCTSSNRRKY